MQRMKSGRRWSCEALGVAARMAVAASSRRRGSCGLAALTGVAVAEWAEARPRWGTYSVRAHTDLRQLIMDALMYDVLVFPCPEDDEDFDRWVEQKWDPELLALRVTQLGDYAVTIPWDRQLRELWLYQYNQLSEEQRGDPNAAYLLTAEQLADQSFITLMGQEDDRFNAVAMHPPQIHTAFAARDGRARAQAQDLELVAAFQRSWESVQLTGASDSADLRNLNFDWPSANGVRVHLPLAVPDDVSEDMFFRVLDTIGRDDFRVARRRLWSWENELPENLQPDEVMACLRALVDDYNKVLAREVKRTRLQMVFMLVPAVVGLGLDLMLAGFASKILEAGADLAIEGVKARFPTLEGAAVRASHHPASALSGMLSVVGPGHP
jgi:hypothetical protein